MKNLLIRNKIKEELLLAMDEYRILTKILIQKIIQETMQPDFEDIAKGHYYKIEDAEIKNGNENLSDDWAFDVHGEHCLFSNTKTGQEIEIFLGNEESLRYLDPIFFFNFLKTTKKYNPLTSYFKNPFQDVLNLFETLEKEGLMENVGGVVYRKK